MDDYTRYLKKKLENPEFRKEWEALETENEMVKIEVETAFREEKVSIK